MDNKAHLKAMINAMIEKDDDTASKEFHSYLAAKMQGTLSQMSTPAELTVDTDEE